MPAPRSPLSQRSYYAMNSAVAILACAVLSSTAHAGAIVTFGDRLEWETAIGGASVWEDNFDGSFGKAFFEEPAYFDEYSLFGKLEPSLSNRIVVDPPRSIDGSVYARLFVREADPRHVAMTFETPVIAWGADFAWIVRLGDSVVVEVSMIGDEPTSEEHRIDNGFFGFMTGAASPVRSLIFKSGGQPSIYEGQSFAMDNLAAVSVPEPGCAVTIASILVMILFLETPIHSLTS